MHITKIISQPILLLSFALMLAGQNGIAQQQQGSTANMLLEGLQVMEYSYPGQKVFIHTDKDEYIAGETIWLKVYVVNATTHRPDTLSTNLYVELFNNRGELASILLMRLDNGYSHGDIFLPDSLPEGSYRISAYTDWMHNFDENLFFSKDIHVTNHIEENFIKRLDSWRRRFFNRKLERSYEDMQFAFFPEGGNLITGLENRVAFKAANSLGGGVEASGMLLDGSGNEILEFSTLHNGMGSFEFTPAAGERYTAVVEFEDGSSDSYRLPAQKQAGYLLGASQDGTNLNIRVAAGDQTPGASSGNELIILLQSRGRAIMLENILVGEDGYSISLPLEELPEGVSQIMLFTPDGQPISERLAFINRGGVSEVNFDGVVVDGDNGDKLRLMLHLPGELSGGSYSLAVLDTESSEPDHSPNIASQFLLFSELGYTAKDPWFYLSEDSPVAREAADLVMMTNGWKRFDWEDLVSGEYPEIKYGFPKGITLRGQVSPQSSDRETGEINVELAVSQDYIDIYTTTTNKQGDFSFSNLEYDGLFTATLRIDRPVHHRRLRADINFRDTEDIEYKNNYNTKPFSVTARGSDWERISKPETMFSSRPMVEPSRESVSMYGTADQVLYFDDIRDQHSSIGDILRSRVRGLRFIDGEIVLRGQSSFQLSNEPVFMIDENFVNRNIFLSVSPHDVDRLAVYSGPSTAILGSRGANGALIIYTRRGDDHRHIGEYEYFLQGFHMPAETFEAKIHTGIYDELGISRTLYWEPDIRSAGNEELDFTFPTDNNVRNLRVIFQGVDENGRLTFSNIVIENTD